MTGMIQQAAEGLLTLLALLIPAGSLTCWVVALRRRRRTGQLLAWEERRPVPWEAVDLGLILLLAFVMTVVVQLVFSQWSGVPLATDVAQLPPDQRLGFVVASFVASLAILALVLAVVRLRAGAGARDLGLRRDKVMDDLRLGVVAFLLLASPVFLIQFGLTHRYPTRHPLVKFLQADPDPRLYAAAFVAAVCVAPLVEEWLFRVLLQGWLEKLAAWWPAALHVSPIVNEPGEEVPGATNAALRPAWWPIAVSALLFALAHYSHGPDPIPLFVLALGLGYLYRQTHRLLPCVVVHLLVNLTTMLQLWVLTQQRSM